MRVISKAAERVAAKLPPSLRSDGRLLTCRQRVLAEFTWMGKLTEEGTEPIGPKRNPISICLALPAVH